MNIFNLYRLVFINIQQTAAVVDFLPHVIQQQSILCSSGVSGMLSLYDISYQHKHHYAVHDKHECDEVKKMRREDVKVEHRDCLKRESSHQ